MSARTFNTSARDLRSHAPLFAALGDEVRLSLLHKLSRAEQLSITQLAEGGTITRQAVAKHLRVLEISGLVRGLRRGRENLFQLDPKPLQQARQALELVSQQWDDALGRLKAFVEK